ncbi:hypothetical protein GVv1_47160 (plasmid) [Enterobacter pseudoroggenkampii]
MKELFEYDVRNRLKDYTVSGSSLPSDAYQNQMLKQTYQYDVLNNLITVTTNLSDGTSDTATYNYDNVASPLLSNIMLNEFDQYLHKRYLSGKARKDRWYWNNSIQRGRITAVRETGNGNLLWRTAGMPMTSCLSSKAPEHRQKPSGRSVGAC